MALSRIWSAFIIIAIVVAAIKCFFFGNTEIFNWIVVGKADDPLNPNKERASNSQIMFLCLHACGPTLIPVSIIAIRASANATNPTDIFIPCMIVTFAATLAALCVVSFRQKINLFQPVILAWILG